MQAFSRIAIQQGKNVATRSTQRTTIKITHDASFITNRRMQFHNRSIPLLALKTPDQVNPDNRPDMPAREGFYHEMRDKQLEKKSDKQQQTPDDSMKKKQQPLEQDLSSKKEKLSKEEEEIGPFTFSSGDVDRRVSAQDDYSIIDELKELGQTRRLISFEAIYSPEARRIFSELKEVAGMLWGEAQKAEKGGQVKEKVAHVVAKEVGLTNEQVQQLTRKVTGIVKQLGLNKDYHSAYQQLLSLMETAGKAAEKPQQFPPVMEKAKEFLEKTSSGESTEMAKNLWSDAKVLAENVLGGGSLDKFITRFQNLKTAVAENPKSKETFKEFKELIADSVKNPDKIGEHALNDKFEKVLGNVRELFQKPEVKKVANELSEEMSSVMSDLETVTTKKFQKGLKELMDHLNEKGGISVDSVLKNLPKFQEAVLPHLKMHVGCVPLPRLMGSSENTDYAITNAKLCLDDIVPSNIRMFKLEDNDVNLKTGELKGWTKVRMTVEGIKFSIKDLQFAYKRKSFPALEDEGVADIKIGSDNMAIVVDWAVGAAPNEPPKFFFQDTYCQVPPLSVDIKEAKHSFLDKVAVALMKGPTKLALKREIEDALMISGRAIAEQLNEAISVAAKEANKK